MGGAKGALENAHESIGFNRRVRSRIEALQQRDEQTKADAFRERRYDSQQDRRQKDPAIGPDERKEEAYCFGFFQYAPLRNSTVSMVRKRI